MCHDEVDNTMLEDLTRLSFNKTITIHFDSYMTSQTNSTYQRHAKISNPESNQSWYITLDGLLSTLLLLELLDPSLSFGIKNQHPDLAVLTTTD